MVGLFKQLEQQARLVGENRFELLLFRISPARDHHLGINVFKVREVIHCPPLRRHPASHPFVRGVASVRDRAIPVIDLGRAMGRTGSEVALPYLIVTEFNRTVQGFLAHGVERILTLDWSTVMPAPETPGRSGYITAVAEIDNSMVEVVDVEKVMIEVLGPPAGLTDGEVTALTASVGEGFAASVMVVDDSSVARQQIRRALEQVGISCVVAKDGLEALETLEGMAIQGSLDQQVQLLISDIEMPRMDGYTLTRRIRESPQLAHLRIMLHSSLSGGFNQAMVDKVGADHWLPKFGSAELAHRVIELLTAEDI